MTSQDTIPASKESLLTIWKVLEGLTVSLDRLGTYERIHGQEAAKEALHHYITPTVFRHIAHARSVLLAIYEQHDPHLLAILEDMSTHDTVIAYWEGPNKSLHE